MLLALFWFPFLGFFCGITCSRLLGAQLKHFNTFCIYCLNIVSTVLLLKIVFYKIILNCTVGLWINMDILVVGYDFQLDVLNSILCFIVSYISLLVHFYSCEYMHNDSHLPRFMTYLSLFTLFMLILLIGNNFLLMFVGWEGVGLASYLLINFWFSRIQANKAAIKAMLFNRFADIAIILALCLLFFTFGTLDYTIIFNMYSLINVWTIGEDKFYMPIQEIIGILLFLGAMGKSAQFGFHNWLPDAMEGPTPVSALIHAATMVTAGVFLLARCSFVFEETYYALILISIIGSCTAFFGATVGFFSNDLKKIIAFSTCSQLGYMMIACGIRQYNLAIFHLTTHAFFKALLFLAAGSIIHALYDEQDIRKMGGLLRYLPLTYTCFIVGSYNLMGLPFLGGFYSKDNILEFAFSAYSINGLFSYIFGILSVIFTAAYSIRLCILVFFKKPVLAKNFIYTTFESSDNIKLPLILLAILSIVCGYYTLEIFTALGNTLFNNIIYNNTTFSIIGDNEFLPIIIKILPQIALLLGIALSIFLYLINPKFLFNFKKHIVLKYIFSFFSKKWYLDRLVNEILVLQLLNLSKTYSYNSLDRGLLEYIGPTIISIEVENFVTIKKYPYNFII